MRNWRIIFATIILFKTVTLNEESPILNFVNELDSTVTGLIEGEEITTGRSALYSYSWELFLDNPIQGIGWKEFINRSQGIINSDQGSHPHNIYLQLLTELGLFGFLLFIIPLLYVYFKTYRLLRLISTEDNYPRNWKLGVQFSFYSQTFFILYGMTGNLLTDYNFLLMYFFACSISLSALTKFKKS